MFALLFLSAPSFGLPCLCLQTVTVVGGRGSLNSQSASQPVIRTRFYTTPMTWVARNPVSLWLGLLVGPISVVSLPQQLRDYLASTIDSLGIDLRNNMVRVVGGLGYSGT